MTRKPVSLVALLLVGLGAVGPAATAQYYPYRLVDLDVTTEDSLGWSISDDGAQIAGVRNPEAFVWQDGSGFRMLGMLPGYTFSYARGLDAAGNACGYSGWEVLGSEPARAVRFKTDGTVENLGTLGGQFSLGYEMNRAGKIVGSAGTQPHTTDWHAFLWQDGVGMIDLYPGTVDSHARDISEFDVVAGFLGINHAFRWDATHGLVDLDAPKGYPNSFAFGINSAGQVCGNASSASANAEVMVRYTDGVGWQVLGGVGEHNIAFKINDFGQVVGRGALPGATSEAMLYTDGFGLQELGTLIDPALGWNLRGAHDINERGQITGYGRIIATGETHGFRLDPNFFVSYGEGFAGSGGHVPVLGGFGVPVAGNTVQLMIAEGNANGTGLLLMAPSPGSVPFGPGSFLLGTPIILAAVVPLDSNRQAYLMGTLPGNTPSGVSVYFQFASLDPGGPNGSIVLSNGLEMIFP
jgi:probable HAF family extracellular repeat protein